ncbi:MAG TPA: iron-containing alcohol dehydrogenase [Streptosporangiaceae bacterium]|nr:iron-containing alcohol dehydrogenase [Streptosporangiaceae bacterium]
MSPELPGIDLDALRAVLAPASGAEPGGLGSQEPVPGGPGGPGPGGRGPADPSHDWPLRPIGLRRVVDRRGALDDIGEVLAGLGAGSGQVVVLAAATPMSVAGAGLRAVVERLAGSRLAVKWVVLGPADGSVHADEETVAAARAAARGASCVVTVGSGTITDIGKAAAAAGTALVAVQTATSVNGYADPLAVLLRDGVKRTTPARWPDALIIDHDVLLGAPAELNRSGLGDMAAMFSSTADWYLASVLEAGGPPYLAQVAGLVRPHGERMFALAEGLIDDADQLAGLARLLTLSGITMGVAGSTAPASGMEHAISHLLEMAATAADLGGAANLHGTTVGVASVVAAATWAHVRQRIADGALARPARLPDPDLISGQISAAFADLDPTGAMAAECLADYSAKLSLLASRPDPLAVLRADWASADAVLDQLLIDPRTLAAGLRMAGLPVRFGELPAPVDEGTARWAVTNCALQRRRFGVADLAMLLGAWTDDDIDAVLAAAEAAAAAAALTSTGAASAGAASTGAASAGAASAGGAAQASAASMGGPCPGASGAVAGSPVVP